MLRRVVVVLCVLATIAGCRSTKAREEERAAECANQADGLRAWLGILEREGPIRPEQLSSRNGNRGPLLRDWSETKLVPLDQKPFDTRRGVTMTLDGGWVHYLDREMLPIESGSFFASAHPGDHTYVATKNGGFLRSRGYIALRIGRDESWQNVVDVISSAYRQRFGDVELVFAGPSYAKPPKPSSLDYRLNAAMHDEHYFEYERVARIGDMTAEMNPGCAELRAVLRAQSDADRPLSSFAIEGPEAVRKCSCSVDFDSIRTFAWYRTGRGWGETTTGKTLVLDDESSTTHRITLPKDMKWSDAAREVIRAIDAEPPDTPFALAVR